MLRTTRHLLLGLLAISLAGCLEWEEAPGGATGFLTIDGVTLSGDFDGETFTDAPVSRSEGWCIPGGFEVELVGETDGRVVMATLTVLDFFPGESAAITVTREAPEDPFLSGASGEKIALAGCAGEADGSWDLETEAESVDVEVEQSSFDEQRVHYTATFAGGDRLEADFNMRMPAVD